MQDLNAQSARSDFMTFNIKDADFDYFIVLNDLETGKRKNIPLKCKAANAEDAAKVMFLKNDFVAVKMNAGMSIKSFRKNEGCKHWMKRRIENIARKDFEDVVTKGVPDFCVADNDTKKLSFVEVKSLGDSLRVSQMNWMTEHQNLPLKIAYVVRKEKWYRKK